MPDFTLLSPRNPPGVALDSLRSEAVALLRGSGATLVTSVTVNSTEVQPGAVFAALPGRRAHGADHAEQALARGAAAILTDADGAERLSSPTVPILVTEDPRAVLGLVSSLVYGTRSRRPRLFGVTGTNGKTSTVHLLDGLLEQLGIPAGHSSTADRRSGPTTVASRLTSPESPELHALLARMVEDGVESAALEVSAQALSNYRVDGLRFDTVGFTNLSHDHMDDYRDMDEYLEAKLRLFRPERADRGVVLLDSPAGLQVRDSARIPVTTITTRPDRASDWVVHVTEVTPTTTSFTLTGPDQQSLTTTIPLVGTHMAADAGLAIVMLTSSGIPFSRVADAVRNGICVSVPGRTELVSGTSRLRVYSDFSHTPDSIAKTLAALRDVTHGRVIVLVGADGDKDATKRIPMGRAAAEGADIVIVTDHHPRFEDPARIRHALVDGARGSGHEHVLEIPSPAVAIRQAISVAEEDDTILWVGPGRTDYRVIEGEDVPYSPRNDARLALHEAGWL